MPGAQVSTVHATPSSQTVAAPGMHSPERQLSSAVQGSPSVQAVPSGTGDPAQTPWLQRSARVHWLPSVQAVPSAAGVPTHKPPLHLSSVVQVFLSLQSARSATPLQSSTMITALARISGDGAEMHPHRKRDATARKTASPFLVSRAGRRCEGSTNYRSASQIRRDSRNTAPDNFFERAPNRSLLALGWRLVGACFAWLAHDVAMTIPHVSCHAKCLQWAHTRWKDSWNSSAPEIAGIFPDNPQLFHWSSTAIHPIYRGAIHLHPLHIAFDATSWSKSPGALTPR